MTDILQKTENVAKNVANENSQDLTEQCKKGELELGKHYYYTTIFSPTVHIQNFTRDVVSLQDFKETVAEVLAPVPSYEELQNMNKAVNECMAANIKLVEQNARLKELLKECQNILHQQTFYRNTILETDETLIKRIVKKAEILQEINELKDKCERLEKQYDRAKWWLNEIVKNHRFTPISTAEKALKDLEESEK